MLIGLFMVFAVPLLIVLGLLGVLLNYSSSRRKPLWFALLFSLLLTPSLAPATINVIPVPFGYHIGVAIFAGAQLELIALLFFFGWWHLIAFPLTALVGFAIGKLVYRQSAEEGGAS